MYFCHPQKYVPFLKLNKAERATHFCRTCSYLKLSKSYISSWVKLTHREVWRLTKVGLFGSWLCAQLVTRAVPRILGWLQPRLLDEEPDARWIPSLVSSQTLLWYKEKLVAHPSKESLRVPHVPFWGPLSGRGVQTTGRSPPFLPPDNERCWLRAPVTEHEKKLRLCSVHKILLENLLERQLLVASDWVGKRSLRRLERRVSAQQQ